MSNALLPTRQASRRTEYGNPMDAAPPQPGNTVSLEPDPASRKVDAGSR